MIVVFWLREDGPQAAAFEANELSIALKFAESLRAARRQGGNKISHVCIQSEMPEAVGQAGVSDAPKDYSWSKRRIDPSIPLGRPSGDDIPVDFTEE